MGVRDRCCHSRFGSDWNIQIENGMIIFGGVIGLDVRSKFEHARGGRLLGHLKNCGQQKTITEMLFSTISALRCGSLLWPLKVATFTGSILARPVGDDSGSRFRVPNHSKNSLSPADDSVVDAAQVKAGVALKACNSGSNGNFADRGSTPLASRCPNDTDGDGDCHLCYRRGGCFFKH
jgi:hypothetical protein